MNGSAWHEQYPGEYDRVRKSIEDEFPYLRFVARGEQSVVTGLLPIVESGKVIAEFEVEIVIPEGGPCSDLPIVREVGGRIPHEADRHNSDGVACLLVTDEFWYRHPNGMEFVDFLRGPVMSFFISQTFYDLHGRWPFDQRSHGIFGILEFWAEVTGSKDLRSIRGFLDAVASRAYKPRRFCPCRSGRRVQDCHAAEILKLRSRIPRPVAARSRSLL